MGVEAVGESFLISSGGWDVDVSLGTGGEAGVPFVAVDMASEAVGLGF